MRHERPGRLSRRLLALVAAAALVIATLAVGSAGARERPGLSEATTATTVPDEAPVEAADRDALRPAVEAYMAEKGVSFDEAVAQLQEMAELTGFADTVRAKDGYAGFKIETTAAGVSGVLALTPGARVRVPAGLDVTTAPARLAERDLPAFSDSMRSQLEAAGVQHVVAVTYDPFEDEVVVWRADVPAASLDARSAVAAQTRSLLGPEFARTPVRFATATMTDASWGGQDEEKYGHFLWFHWESGHCTSGFGVSKLISGVWKYGYLTAGHCRELGGTGWKVLRGPNTYTVVGYHNKTLGGYKDRVVFEAGGASYLVKVSPASNQDMVSTPTHLYQGSFYCHYGSNSNDQDCSTLNAVNVPGSYAGYSFWFFEAGTAATCIKGDSGGPVWQPNYPYSSIPAGLIEASYQDNDQCLYLSLDDNLAGSGWALL